MEQHLYDMTGDYLRLYQMAEEEDIDPEVWFDTMEAIEGAIEEKAANYVHIIKNLDADAAEIRARAAKFKEEAERLEAKAKSKDSAIERLKSGLTNAMVTTGKTKFKTDDFSFWTADTKSVELADDVDTTKVPVDYLTFKDPVINKTAVKKALEAGETFDFATLKVTTGVRYR